MALFNHPLWCISTNPVRPESHDGIRVPSLGSKPLTLLHKLHIVFTSP